MTSYPINFEDLNIISYQDALDYQEKLFQRLMDAKLQKNYAENANYVLFCEHPHVYTIGKSGDTNNLLLNQMELQHKEIQFFKTNRGGDITYHGYGQIVCYPIFDLDDFGIGLRKYIWNLEEVVMLTLRGYGIASERIEGASGVWLRNPDRKICAIGVKSSRMITMHGFALNINTDLRYFDYINPCGFTDKGVTSLEKELYKKIDLDEVKEQLKKAFIQIFCNH